MDPKASQFFQITKECFSFLEDHYGYHFATMQIDDPEYFQDATAKVVYVNDTVGIEMYWYFSSGFIDVLFAELLTPGEFPPRVKLFENSAWKRLPNAPKSITLSTLAQVLQADNDPAFLLKEYENLMPSKCIRRAKIIDTNMQSVMEGLAVATQKFATPILQGDISLFPQVIQYYTSLMQKVPGFL